MTVANCWDHSRLIGLTGAAGAGKDETANILCVAGWRRLAFADALRIEVAKAWGVDLRELTDRAGKETAGASLAVKRCLHIDFSRWCRREGIDKDAARSPRWVMQAWGSYRRADDRLYWVAMVRRWIDYQRGRNCHLLVISDVRMSNEASMLRQAGGLLLRVHRPGLAALPEDTSRHASEGHHLLTADADLHNDGDLEHLAAELWRVLHGLKHPNGATA
jgi:hypothetical protein